MFTNSPSTSRQILTVTKLNRLARTVLEGEIGLIWLSAEISNFVAAASGHWYFTLKDNKAQVRAAMFKGANRTVRIRPKEGDKILVRASVGLYEARGDYQLVVEHMESDGEGALKQAFEALKFKLNSEGLFDTASKRPLPERINRIGVITSSSGAALHDVLSVLKRRSPQTEIIVYPSMVQGESAPQQLISALQAANRRLEVDVVLLTRGGGSLEDLWCFNDETLAREIAQSQLPIVSAVGHEVDFTIADFVADLRAPTPSAAAEILSQDSAALIKLLDTQRVRLTRAIYHYLEVNKQRFNIKQQRLHGLHPQNRIQHQWQSLDNLQMKLQHQIHQVLTQSEKQLHSLSSRLAHQSPTTRLATARDKLQRASERLHGACHVLIKSKKNEFSKNVSLLQSVSPLSTLARGYSITLSNARTVNHVNSVEVGDEIKTRVTDGEITSKVTGLNQYK
ncbi:exodeoxyribonuclease VII large subunit [Alteromonas sp. D210916BOD_24]|uniref:exodeoxyribonuclease VII large subunit n=1 Tax=Alteromonas sp. D210916BOD_24 TaxID=3157618 RepID=UPI00399D43E0